MSASADNSILIVEDHPDTAEMLRLYLGRHGMHADVAPTGPAALELLSHHRPRCMIVDETMPEMTGLEFVRHCRQHPDYHDIPVVFYSAAFERRKQAEAASLGATAWYIKGISRLEDLRSHVADCCQS
jgi:CheY-like chemotaxis protein